MIRLEVNTEGQLISTDPIRLVRGDRLTMEVVWVTDRGKGHYPYRPSHHHHHHERDVCPTVNRPWEFVKFGANASGDYTGNLLVECTEWEDRVSLYGERSSRGLLKMDKDALLAAIGDRYEICLQAEFQFEDVDSGEVATSQRLSLIVRNDVIKSYQSEPEPEPADVTDGVGTLHTYLCNPSRRDYVGRLVPDGSWWDIASYQLLYDKVRSFAEVHSDNLRFRIPTLHNDGSYGGLFLRGANMKHPVGREQDDAMQQITGRVNAMLLSNDSGYRREGALTLSNGYGYGNTAIANIYGQVNAAHVLFNSGDSPNARVEDETHPANITVWWLIQYCTDRERQQLLESYEV